MRIRLLVLMAVAFFQLAPMIPLASGKLDASQSCDFACSVVNKNPEHISGENDITVTITLKDSAGNTAIDPTTFLPATLTTTIAPKEAAMLSKPANFVGTESLYCWAEVPGDSAVFGTFLVRDAQERAKASTPLEPSIADFYNDLLDKTEEIQMKLDDLLEEDD